MPRGGLWGNHGYEAAYPMTYTDADGDQLVGRNRYTLTLSQDPPVDAFWSITMYDLPDFYLVANPISRYSIGDRTPGLRRNSDGSLTILIQNQPPADTSNWLPAPATARRRRTLGEDHPDTLAPAGNLVIDLRALGEIQNATGR